MDALRKTWVRIIISLFGGGMASELIHVLTGDPNRPMTTNLSLLYALIIFFILSIVANRTKKPTK